MKQRLLWIGLLTWALASCASHGPGLAGWGQAEGFAQGKAGQKSFETKAQALVQDDATSDAQTEALNRARLLALDQAARQVLTDAEYNNNAEALWRRWEKRNNEFVAVEKLEKSGPLFEGKTYGVSASLLLDRVGILRLLQRELKIKNSQGQAIVILIETPQTQDLQGLGFSSQDLETGLAGGLETRLNQAGLTAINPQNPLLAGKLTPEAWAKIIQGQANPETLQALQGIAQVVVKLNVEQVTFANSRLSINLALTAINISQAQGGAFVQTRLLAERTGGGTAQPAAMVAAAMNDLLGDLEGQFLTALLEEMNQGGSEGAKKLPYRLSLLDADQDDAEELAAGLSGLEGLKVGQAGAQGGSAWLEVRFAGSSEQFRAAFNQRAKEKELGVILLPASPGLLDLTVVAKGLL